MLCLISEIAYRCSCFCSCFDHISKQIDRRDATERCSFLSASADVLTFQQHCFQVQASTLSFQHIAVLSEWLWHQRGKKKISCHGVRFCIFGALLIKRFLVPLNWRECRHLYNTSKTGQLKLKQSMWINETQIWSRT